MVPTTKSVSRIIIREQPELVAQFVRVPRPETAGTNIQQLQCPILLNFPCQHIVIPTEFSFDKYRVELCFQYETKRLFIERETKRLQ